MLLELLDDKDRRERIGMRGREAVYPKYSKERMVHDIEDLYEECLNNKSINLREGRNR